MQLIPFLIGSTYLRQIKGFDLSELSEIALPKGFLDKVKALIEKEHVERRTNIEIPDEILSMLEEGKRSSIYMDKVREILARQTLILTPDLIPAIKTQSIDINTWRTIIDSLDETKAKAFSDFLIKHRDTLQGVWYANTKRARRSVSVTLDTFRKLDNYFSYLFERSIKYLGPLRNEPQAMYQAFDLSEPTKVGLKGEYTAAVLHINKSRKIKYPAIVEREDGKISFQEKEQSLEDACTHWLKYLGVVTNVRTVDRGKLGYELQVKTTSGDKFQDLTHVGVGVSQILPIVVMSLLADKDDILIFEQPELHLHPKIQSRLCDFFIAISELNSQCIIETHSEYLINRLRLRIAESRDDKIGQHSTVVFIEKNGENSTIRSVDITKFGSIIDWPKDFFDQSDIEIEKILLEATRKKRELLESTKETR